MRLKSVLDTPCRLLRRLEHYIPEVVQALSSLWRTARSQTAGEAFKYLKMLV